MIPKKRTQKERDVKGNTNIKEGARNTWPAGLFFLSFPRASVHAARPKQKKRINIREGEQYT